MEALRHIQAKCADLEKTNKKLQGNAHTDRKEIIRLKEELQAHKSKVLCTRSPPSTPPAVVSVYCNMLQ